MNRHVRRSVFYGKQQAMIRELRFTNYNLWPRTANL